MQRIKCAPTVKLLLFSGVWKSSITSGYSHQQKQGSICMPYQNTAFQTAQGRKKTKSRKEQSGARRNPLQQAPLKWHLIMTLLRPKQIPLELQLMPAIHLIPPMEVTLDLFGCPLPAMQLLSLMLLPLDLFGCPLPAIKLIPPMEVTLDLSGCPLSAIQLIPPMEVTLDL